MRGFFRLCNLHDPFNARFREHLQVFGGQPQALGAHGDLLQRFLASDVQGRNARRQVADRLKQQRALAGARMAAHQDGGTLHQASSEHAIELLHAGADAGLLCKTDVVQAFHFRQTACEALEAAPAGTSGVTPTDPANFADRVPGLAGGALSLPLGIVCTALGADVGGFRFCHQASFLYFMRWGTMAESPLRFL